MKPKFKVGDLIEHPIGGIGFIVKIYSIEDDFLGNKYKIFIKNHRDDKTFFTFFCYAELMCE